MSLSLVMRGRKHGLQRCDYPPPVVVGDYSSSYYTSNSALAYAQNNADTRKRQRRQAAGNLVSGLFATASTGTTPSGRKSTAQPRPDIQIPPKGIGPVYDPNENDVLCGRGGRINAHAGNVQFREIVVVRKKAYLAKETKKLEKGKLR
jgi:hypothetical protein